jgi:hypothetical protein
MKFRFVAALLWLIPSLAFARQGYNPNDFFQNTYSALIDPSTGTVCTASTPCSILSTGGGGGGYTKPYQYTPIAGSQYGLSVTTATGLTVPTGALYATIIIEGGQVRYSSTTTPTASAGMLLQPGGPYSFSISPLSSLKFIDATGSTATLDVEYSQ